MNNHIINAIASIVETACKSEKNIFGAGIWEEHILEVVKYVEALAIQFQADREICILAALLHDYAGIYNHKYYKNHHIHSMKAAEHLLSRYNYPQDKINHVKEVIFSHRGSVKKDYQSIEAACLANADAIAHINQYKSLINYAHNIKKMSWHQSRQFVANKIERSFNKMTDYAKDLFYNRYNQIVNQLKIAS